MKRVSNSSQRTCIFRCLNIVSSNLHFVIFLISKTTSKNFLCTCLFVYIENLFVCRNFYCSICDCYQATGSEFRTHEIYNIKYKTRNIYVY